MQIKDYSIHGGGSDARNNSLLMPQWPYRGLIVGLSACGKTNLLLAMLLEPNMLAFDRLFVISPSLSQEKYKLLISEFEKKDASIVKEIEKLIKAGPERDAIITKLEPIARFYDTADDFLDDGGFNLFDKTNQNLVILDDIMLDNKQNPFIELFSRGRHYNASTIYISQSYFRVPKTIRDNVSFLILYSMNSREINMLYNSIGSDLEKDE